MRIFHILALVAAASTLPLQAWSAQENQDALASQRAAASPAADEGTGPFAKGDSEQRLRDDLQSFREKLPTMAAGEAAKRWLSLAQRLAYLPRNRDADFFLFDEESTEEAGHPLTFRDVLAILPPPDAWVALAKEAEAITAGPKSAPEQIALRFMAHWLTSDLKAQAADAKALETALSGTRMRQYRSYLTRDLRTALLHDSDDGVAVLAILNGVVDDSANLPEATELAVPDLITLVGEEKAAGFLRHALGSGKFSLRIEQGVETQKLARKIAVELGDQLKAPQWFLACSLDATSLYELMAKRFTETAQGRYERRQANSYYLLGLIVAHRTADAAKVARELGAKASSSLSHEAIMALERGGHRNDLVTFFHDLLSQNPDLPFWNDYVRLAAKAGQTEATVTLAESSAKREGLIPKQRQRIRIHLRNAYLAADNVDAALELLRKEIAEATHDTSAEEQESSGHSHGSDEAGLALAKLGVVLRQKELVAEGARAVREVVQKDAGNPKKRDERCRSLNRLAEVLIQDEQGPEAETVLRESLAILSEKGDEQSFDPPERDTLGLLVGFYHHTHRSADVLTVFEHAPQWRASDLSSLVAQTVRVGANEEYLGYFAARALTDLGRKPEAARVLDALLERIGGYDPAYELLTELAPAEALAKLDNLFQRDQFEERPLIWKAKLLLAAKRLPEAEEAARKAIAIDPSDGEQGPGRRMLVYAVLADIREARGDAKEAKGLREAVTAIRQSEAADRFYGAGLVTRAVKMYEEALGHFADAYCIQSRLALRLSELGDADGAEQHYRRAYELMPESFGRVESHCFGCERAFEGERAQSVAEKVFTDLATKNPQSPQVHYLLGYLRKEQERYRDALPEFRTAIKLDPEYLNAWKQLADVGEKVRLPRTERQSIQLKMLELDPVNRHVTFDINRVSDLQSAWTALEEAARRRVPAPAALFPLPAAADELRSEAKAAPTSRPSAQVRYFTRDFDRAPNLAPAAVLSRHRFLRALGNFFDFGLRE